MKFNDPEVIKKSTILTADYGTGEKKDEYNKLDNLKSHILL